jgi:hypothetical protein
MELVVGVIIVVVAVAVIVVWWRGNRRRVGEELDALRLLVDKHNERSADGSPNPKE